MVVALSVLGALMSVVVASSPGGTAGFGSATRIPPARPQPGGTPSPPQLPDLNPDLCATTFMPLVYSSGRRDSNATEADCRTIIAWRNAVVNHPGSVIGPNHPLALIGTGDYTRFDQWADTGLVSQLFYVDTSQTFWTSQYIISAIHSHTYGLAGPLPGELPHLRELRLPGNSLSGELPSWIYNHPKLEDIRLQDNRLSGEVSAFTAPKLEYLDLSGNYFSGSLPDFDTAGMFGLINIGLSDNQFSGPIPASWSGFANSGRNRFDRKGIQQLDISQNNISGDLPSWVSNLPFRNTPGGDAFLPGYLNLVRMSNNNLCIPDSFQIPAYRKAAPYQYQYAKVRLELEPQQCPTSKTLIRRAQNIQFEPVRTPGQQPTDDPAGLKVTWSKPSGMTGAVTYRVQLFLTTDQEVIRGSGRTYDKYCYGHFFWQVNVGPLATANLERTVTRSDCSVTDTRTIFDPTKYTVDVSVLLKNQQTTYVGSATFSNAWSVFTADNPQKTFQDVANIIRLPFQRSIWIWDAANQIWFERSQDQPNFATLNLQRGDSLAFQRTVPVSWLNPAGLSTADEDTPVQLQNGWNIISAGAEAARPDDNNGAYFIDDDLINCASLQGVIAIMRYNTQTQQFDAELPCHPRAEANLTRTPAIGTIDDLEEADILFIYFQTIIPVTIQWDATTSQYTPTS